MWILFQIYPSSYSFQIWNQEHTYLQLLDLGFISDPKSRTKNTHCGFGFGMLDGGGSRQGEAEELPQSTVVALFAGEVRNEGDRRVGDEREVE